MIVSMHQSQYLPWPPLLRKIAASDVFVLMDDVQYQKNGVQNRNQIRNANGAFWLTIPVTGSLDDTIAEKRIADDRWAKKHWKSLVGSYGKAPHWDELAPLLEPVYLDPPATLGAVNGRLLTALFDRCGIRTEVVLLSSLGATGAKSDLVVDACRRVGASTYRTGRGALDYLDHAAFEEAGIDLIVDDSVPPTYDQGYDDFIAGLSSVDMLAHVDDEFIAAYLETT